MNLDSLISSSSIKSDTLTATFNRHNYTSALQTMPQRSPFAIQELLGLSESSRQTSNVNSGGAVNHSNVPTSNVSSSAVSVVTPSMYSQSNPIDHHQQMQMASRMAYFNAHAAANYLTAAFLPHNMSSGGAGPLGMHSQSAGKFSFLILIFLKKKILRMLILLCVAFLNVSQWLIHIIVKQCL